MNNVNIHDIMPTSLDTITCFGKNGGAFLFELDELSDATISNTQDNTPLTGAGGRTLGQLKRNKQVTISGTNGLVSAGLMAANLGTDVETGEQVVRWTEIVKVTGNSATMDFQAVGTVGNEIGSISVLDDDGVEVSKLTQDATAAAGKFSYAPSTKKITTLDIEEGTLLSVRYRRSAQGQKVSNISDSYSDVVEMVIDATGKDKCQRVYHIQFFVPYADFTGNFDLALGGDQTTHGFEATSLATACGTGKVKFYDYIVIGE